MDLQLRGKTALVTGASKGIGLSVARLLAEEGCALHLAARSGADLAKARDEIRGRWNVQVDIHALDLAAPGAMAELAAACPDIDVLINNAGAVPAGDIAAVDEARWRAAWDLKVFGYVNLTREVYAAMKARGGGVIVNVIGLAGERPSKGYIAGSAGNAALMAFTRGIGGASLADGIRVVAVNPGLIATERMFVMLKGRAKDRFGDESRWEEMMPSDPPPGTPEQVADLVVYLASPRAGHVTGTVVTIDGGQANR